MSRPDRFHGETAVNRGDPDQGSKEFPLHFCQARGRIGDYVVSSRRNSLKSISKAVVLAGISVSAHFSALVGLAEYFADADTQLPGIVYWLLGSFAAVSQKSLIVISVPTLVAGINDLIQHSLDPRKAA